MEIQTMGFKISQEQEIDLKNWALELEQLVKRYRIANDPVDAETARSVPNERIFSCETDWIYPAANEDGVHKCGFGLVAGFYEDCDDYFIAEVPFDAEPDTAYTELRVLCIVCDGEAEDEDGEECENCEEGELVFGLTWDGNGTVSASLN